MGLCTDVKDGREKERERGEGGRERGRERERERGRERDWLTLFLNGKIQAHTPTGISAFAAAYLALLLFTKKFREVTVLLLSKISPLNSLCRSWERKRRGEGAGKRGLCSQWNTNCTESSQGGEEREKERRIYQVYLSVESRLQGSRAP